MGIKEAERAISLEGQERRGQKRSLLGGVVFSWLHQEHWLASCAGETLVLLVRGADVLAVDKMSRCGMWLDT